MNVTKITTKLTMAYLKKRISVTITTKAIVTILMHLNFKFF